MVLKESSGLPLAAALKNITTQPGKKYQHLNHLYINLPPLIFGVLKKIKIEGNLTGKNKVCLGGRRVNQEQSYRRFSVVFSSKLFGILGLGQTDQRNTSLPSFQPQNIFLNFKIFEGEMLHLLHNFLLLNMMERECQLLPLVPKMESGQWKKLRLCFFSTHLLRF